MSKAHILRAAPLIFLLLWSGGYTVAKVGISDADPITLLSLRYFCVLALLLPLFIWYRPALPETAAEWKHLVIVGLLIQVVYFGTAWIALSLGGAAGTVALITSLQPILVALVLPKISKEKVTATGWLGLGLGLLGAALVIFGNKGVQIVTLPVVIFSTIALVAFSTATILEKKFGAEHHPLTSNIVQYMVGFTCTLPIAWLLEPMQLTITTPFVLALFYLVVGNSILAISLLLMMIRNGEATRVTALFFLVPPVSAIIAWLILKEQMTLLAWMGLAIAAAGVWIVTRERRKPAADHPQPGQQ